MTPHKNYSPRKRIVATPSTSSGQAPGAIEATALGNVMMQAIATGHLADVAAGREAIATSFERSYYEPQPSEAWRAAYERMMEL